MAHKYGGFKNFWYYNKLKIFALIFTIALIALTISQCSFGRVLDLGIVHVSPWGDVDGDTLLERLKNDAGLKKSGEELILEFTPIYMPDDFSKGAELGSIEKAQIEITSGGSTLFILDKETVYSYRNDDIFYDLTSIADEYGVDEQKRYLGEDGSVMAICIDGNSFLDECGVPSQNLYIAVRNHPESDREEYENAFTALEYIIANGTKGEEQ